MGGRGKPRNSENLPRWAAEFGKRRRGIWQNLPRKTVGPTHVGSRDCVLDGAQISQSEGAIFEGLSVATSDPLKSIVSHWATAWMQLKKSLTASLRLHQPTLAGVTLTFLPCKIPPPCSADCCQNSLTTFLFRHNFYLPHRRWWEVMFLFVLVCR